MSFKSNILSDAVVMSLTMQPQKSDSSKSVHLHRLHFFLPLSTTPLLPFFCLFPDFATFFTPSPPPLPISGCKQTLRPPPPSSQLISKSCPTLPQAPCPDRDCMSWARSLRQRPAATPPLWKPGKKN